MNYVAVSLITVKSPFCFSENEGITRAENLKTEKQYNKFIREINKTKMKHSNDGKAPANHLKKAKQSELHIILV